MCWNNVSHQVAKKVCLQWLMNNWSVYRCQRSAADRCCWQKIIHSGIFFFFSLLAVMIIDVHLHKYNTHVRRKTYVWKTRPKDVYRSRQREKEFPHIKCEAFIPNLHNLCFTERSWKCWAKENIFYQRTKVCAWVDRARNGAVIKTLKSTKNISTK